LGLVLYDKGPTGAIPKPGKDAIVSITAGDSTVVGVHV